MKSVPTTPAVNNNNEPLWTALEVAAFLRVSSSWVNRAAKCGELPSLWVGTFLRFVPEQIRTYALSGAPRGGARGW